MRRGVEHGGPPSIGGADRLGLRYERQLARQEQTATAGGDGGSLRRSHGIFYTPSSVVDLIVDGTLRPLLIDRPARDGMNLRIIDPACGCGAFLLGAFRWLCGRHEEIFGRPPSAAQRRTIARDCLAGIDLDPLAVKLARQALAQEASLAPSKLAENFRVGDALLSHDEWFCGAFDAVVTNPPFVNIRRLVKSHGKGLADAYRRRYRCAQGAFDLYVLFLERSAAALRNGGRLGAIIPNKLATLDYARACRELLLEEGTLDTVVDVSHLGIFADADVYPYIVLWTKQPAPRDHAIRVVRPASLADLASISSRHTPYAVAASEQRALQSQQCAARGLTLSGDLDVESQVATVPLGELCAIHSGATGFQAAELSARLMEGNAEHSRSEGSTFDFIVSGNIDPYAIHLGDVRFIGRQLARPILAAADPILTANKRRLYAAEKIVLAGMCRRLEAAWDRRGLALGVQVYALTDWKVEPLYLLGLLNSSFLSHLFRLRFAAKRLAGGYFSLSKRQLSQLPIRVIDPSDRRERQVHDQLVRLVQRRMEAGAASQVPRTAIAADLDLKIDDLVYQLYRADAKPLASLPAAA